MMAMNGQRRPDNIQNRVPGGFRQPMPPMGGPQRQSLPQPGRGVSRRLSRKTTFPDSILPHPRK